MSNPEVLYTTLSSAVDPIKIKDALATAFSVATRHPGYDMEGYKGVAVIIDPGKDLLSGDERILAIGAVGNMSQMDEQRFTLHAMSRADVQSRNRRKFDNHPYERLGWLRSNRSTDKALHKASGASFNNLHVAAAGGPPHHNRQFAIEIARKLGSYGDRGRFVQIPAHPAAVISIERDENEVAQNIDFLNNLPSQDCKDSREVTRSLNYRAMINRLIGFPDTSLSV